MLPPAQRALVARPPLLRNSSAKSFRFTPRATGGSYFEEDGADAWDDASAPLDVSVDAREQQERAQFLKYGDVVALHDPSLNGYLHCGGHYNVQCGLECSMSETEAPERFHQCLFVVLPSRRYRAVKAYQKAVQEGALGIGTASAATAATRLFLKRLEEGVRTEESMNEAVASKMYGRNVEYGQVIQLLHVHSGKYVTIRPDVVSVSERDCVSVEVDPNGSDGSWLTIEPATRARSDGEFVFCEDPFRLRRAKWNVGLRVAPVELPRDELVACGVSAASAAEQHAFATRFASMIAARHEVNASAEATVFQYFLYDQAVPDPVRDLMLHAGDVVVLENEESRTVLATPELERSSGVERDVTESDGADDDSDKAAGKARRASLKVATGSSSDDADDNKLAPVMLDERLVGVLSLNGLWRVELEHVDEGGPVTYDAHVRLQHVNTMRYLAICPKQMSKDKAHLSLVRDRHDARTLLSLYAARGVSEGGVRRGGAVFLGSAATALFLASVSQAGSAGSAPHDLSVRAAGAIPTYPLGVAETRAHSDAFVIRSAQGSAVHALFFLWELRASLERYHGDLLAGGASIADPGSAAPLLRALQLVVWFAQGAKGSVPAAPSVGELQSHGFRIVDEATGGTGTGPLSLLHQDALRDARFPTLLVAMLRAPMAGGSFSLDRLHTVHPTLFAVMRMTYRALLSTYRGHHLNASRASSFLPVLVSQLGHELRAAEAITHILQNNRELLDAVGEKTVRVFLDLIARRRDSGKKVRYVSFLRALVECDGAPVRSKQDLVVALLGHSEYRDEVLLRVRVHRSRVWVTCRELAWVYFPLEALCMLQFVGHRHLAALPAYFAGTLGLIGALCAGRHRGALDLLAKPFGKGQAAEAVLLRPSLADLAEDWDSRADEFGRVHVFAAAPDESAADGSEAFRHWGSDDSAAWLDRCQDADLDLADDSGARDWREGGGAAPDGVTLARVAQSRGSGADDRAWEALVRAEWPARERELEVLREHCMIPVPEGAQSALGVLALPYRDVASRMRGAFVRLAIRIAVDIAPHEPMRLPSLTREVGGGRVTRSSRDGSDGASSEDGLPCAASRDSLAGLRDAVSGHLQSLQGQMVVAAGGDSELVLAVTELAHALVRFGAFGSLEELTALVAPLACVLDGRNDVLMGPYAANQGYGAAGAGASAAALRAAATFTRVSSDAPSSPTSGPPVSPRESAGDLRALLNVREISMREKDMRKSLGAQTADAGGASRSAMPRSISEIAASTGSGYWTTPAGDTAVAMMLYEADDYTRGGRYHARMPGHATLVRAKVAMCSLLCTVADILVDWRLGRLLAALEAGYSAPGAMRNAKRTSRSGSSERTSDDVAAGDRELEALGKARRRGSSSESNGGDSDPSRAIARERAGLVENPAESWQARAFSGLFEFRAPLRTDRARTTEECFFDGCAIWTVATPRLRVATVAGATVDFGTGISEFRVDGEPFIAKSPPACQAWVRALRSNAYATLDVLAGGQLQAVLTDLCLYDNAQLALAALRVLVRHTGARDDVLSALQNTQLITTRRAAQQLRAVKKALGALREDVVALGGGRAATAGQHAGLNGDSRAMLDERTVRRAVAALVRLRRLCVADGARAYAQDAQDLVRGAGAHEVALDLIAAVRPYLRDVEANSGRASRPVSPAQGGEGEIDEGDAVLAAAVARAAMRLLRAMVAGNRAAQHALMPAFWMCVPLMRTCVGAPELAAALLRNNEANALQVDERCVAQLADAACVLPVEERVRMLEVFAHAAAPEDRPVKRNQLAIIKALVDPQRRATLLSLATEAGAWASLVSLAGGGGRTDRWCAAEALPPAVRYHASVVTLLCRIAEGYVDYAETVCQNLLPLRIAAERLVDPVAPAAVRLAYARFVYTVHFEVRDASLRSNGDAWILLEAIAAQLHELETEQAAGKSEQRGSLGERGPVGQRAPGAAGDAAERPATAYAHAPVAGDLGERGARGDATEADEESRSEDDDDSAGGSADEREASDASSDSGDGEHARREIRATPAASERTGASGEDSFLGATSTDDLVAANGQGGASAQTDSMRLLLATALCQAVEGFVSHHVPAAGARAALSGQEREVFSHLLATSRRWRRHAYGSTPLGAVLDATIRALDTRLRAAGATGMRAMPAGAPPASLRRAVGRAGSLWAVTDAARRREKVEKDGAAASFASARALIATVHGGGKLAASTLASALAPRWEDELRAFGASAARGALGSGSGAQAASSGGGALALARLLRHMTRHTSLVADETELYHALVRVLVFLVTHQSGVYTGNSSRRSGMDRDALRRAQDFLVRIGAVDLILRVMSHVGAAAAASTTSATKGNAQMGAGAASPSFSLSTRAARADVFDDTLRLGIALLEGGNHTVQAMIFSYLTERSDRAFVTECRVRFEGAVDEIRANKLRWRHEALAFVARHGASNRTVADLADAAGPSRRSASFVALLSGRARQGARRGADGDQGSGENAELVRRRSSSLHALLDDGDDDAVVADAVDDAADGAGGSTSPSSSYGAFGRASAIFGSVSGAFADDSARKSAASGVLGARGGVAARYRSGPVVLLLRFLQLLCEGHNASMQRFLRAQPGNGPVVDLVSETVRFLQRLEKYINRENVSAAIQVLDTLIDFVQGPCTENQMALLDAAVVERCNAVLRRDYTALQETANGAEQVSMLKDRAVVLLTALLEGHANDAYVHARVLRALDLDALRDRLLALHAAFPDMQVDPGDTDSLRAAASREAFNIFLLLRELSEHSAAAATTGGAQLCALLDPAQLPPLGPADLGATVSAACSQCGGPVAPLEDPAAALADSKRSLCRRCAWLEVLEHFGARTGRVEVVASGRGLERLYFPVPRPCAFLSKEHRRDMVWNVRRDTQSEKLADFYERTTQVLGDLRLQEQVQKQPLLQTFAQRRSQVMWFGLILSIAINALIVFGYEADRGTLSSDFQSLTGGVSVSSSALETALTGLSIAHACYAVLMAFLVSSLYGPLGIRRKWSERVAARAARRGKSGTEDDVETLLDAEVTVHELLEYGPPDLGMGPGAYSEYNRAKLTRGAAVVYYALSSFYMASVPIVLRFFAYLLMSVLGAAVHPFFFAYHLVDLIFQSPILLSIVRAIAHRRKQLAVMVLFAFTIIYGFALFAFYYFRPYIWRDDATEEYVCDDLLNCFLFFIGNGFRLSEGISQIFRSPDYADTNWVVYRTIYDIVYFLLVTLIMGSVILGIIIDTFNDLRVDRERRFKDMKERCFICGIESSEFDRRGDGFEEHTTTEHNMWDYLNFLIHIMLKDPTERTGLEEEIARKLSEGDFSFFPVNQALSLTSHEKKQIGSLSDAMAERVVRRVKDETFGARLTDLASTMGEMQTSLRELRRAVHGGEQARSRRKSAAFADSGSSAKKTPKSGTMHGTLASMAEKVEEVHRALDELRRGNR